MIEMWQFWLTLLAVPTIMGAVWTFIIKKGYTRFEKTKQEDMSLKEGTQALLMERLEVKHDLYMHQGYCSFRDKAIYEKMYKAYHNLGKNGVMTSAYEEVMNLPCSIGEYNENK